MEQELDIQLDEINWHIIVRDLLHNLHLIIMAGFMILMGVQIYGNVLRTPQYTSTATLAVTVRGSTSGIYATLSTAGAMAEVYSDIFEDDVIRENVTDALGELPDDVIISSEIINNTNLLNVNVSAFSPKTAYLVIQAVLDNYESMSDYLFGNASVEIIKNPKVPVEPSNEFRILFYSGLGGLAGAFLMACIIALFSILRDTVKMPEKARRNLEGECLGVLPYEEKNRTLMSRVKKVNKGLLLSNPVISFRFEESYNQLASRLDYKMKQKEYQVLMVTSVAENEGKSTVAVNLAMSLSRRNKRVMIIDLDLAKPALAKLLECNIPDDGGLNAFFEGKKTIKEIMVHDKEKGIYAIMDRSSVQDGQMYLTSDRLRRLILACRRVFDYVILDTSPLSAGTDAENALHCADGSVLVIRQDGVKINDINEAIANLKDGGRKFMGYILNGFDEAGTGGRLVYGAYDRYDRKIQYKEKRSGE